MENWPQRKRYALTPERHQLILSMLKEKGVARIQELVEQTGASESTVRRDLIELEEKRLVKRVHGGAAWPQNKIEEPSIQEKSVKYAQQKIAIGRYAASLIEERDSIFIDAGTTTSQMLPFIPHDQIVVVTNGVDGEHGLTTPDPDEAYVKQLALQYSDARYVLCDSTKFSRVTFAKVGELDQVTVITDDGLDAEQNSYYAKRTQLKVVKA